MSKRYSVQFFRDGRPVETRVVELASPRDFVRPSTLLVAWRVARLFAAVGSAWVLSRLAWAGTIALALVSLVLNKSSNALRPVETVLLHVVETLCKKRGQGEGRSCRSCSRRRRQ